MDNPAPTARLAQSIGPVGFFTLSFGSIVGSGWVVVLGSWFALAGPGGSILAFALGGIAMMIVAGAYAELATRMPNAGGEITYVMEGLGPRPAFMVGWFLSLFFISFTAFEGIALAWFVDALWPTLRSAPLYTLLGKPTGMTSLAIGLGGAAFFTFLNCLGAGRAVMFQRIVTIGFILVAIYLVGAGLAMGNITNARPLFATAEGGSLITGIFWVFGTSAVFLTGFQSAAYAIEERSPGLPVRTVVLAMLAGVAAAVLFYCAIMLATASAMPWRALLDIDVPAAAAFGALTPSGILRTVVLVAAGISLLKTWNALHLAAARLIMTQARLGFLPGWLSHIDPQTQVPRRAILFVGCGTCLGVLLGRGAVIPIINMSAICLTITFILCLWVVMRLRARFPAQESQFTLPGGKAVLIIGLATMMISAGVAIYEPVTRSSGIPVEWILLGGWSLLGVLLHQSGGSRRTPAAETV